MSQNNGIQEKENTTKKSKKMLLKIKKIQKSSKKMILKVITKNIKTKRIKSLL